MEMNYGVLALAALVPLVIGFIWYNQKVFGNAWMKTVNLTEEDAGKGNMLVIFILTYIFSFFLSMALMAMVIHQNHIASILLSEPGFGEAGSEVQNLYDSFMASYGSNFRTFRHGAFHGVIYSIFLVLPILGINAMFEKKGGKYIFINVGYWAVCLAVMGGIVCQWA